MAYLIKSDVTNSDNWIGRAAALNQIQFSVGLDPIIHKDNDGDGFSDDDLNRDGFHDDDGDPNGIRDHNDNNNRDDDKPQPEPQPQPDFTALGKISYQINCAACHNSDPTANKDGILRAANNPNAIGTAIDRNEGGMGFLKSMISAEDMKNLSIYIAALFYCYKK